MTNRGNQKDVKHETHEDRRKELIRWMKAHPRPISASTIREHLAGFYSGSSERAVRSDLEILQRRGLVKREGALWSVVT